MREGQTHSCCPSESMEKPKVSFSCPPPPPGEVPKEVARPREKPALWVGHKVNARGRTDGPGDAGGSDRVRSTLSAVMWRPRLRGEAGCRVTAAAAAEAEAAAAAMSWSHFSAAGAAS